MAYKDFPKFFVFYRIFLQNLLGQSLVGIHKTFFGTKFVQYDQTKKIILPIQQVKRFRRDISLLKTKRNASKQNI